MRPNVILPAVTAPPPSNSVSSNSNNGLGNNNIHNHDHDDNHRVVVAATAAAAASNGITSGSGHNDRPRSGSFSTGVTGNAAAGAGVGVGDATAPSFVQQQHHQHHQHQPVTIKRITNSRSSPIFMMVYNRDWDNILRRCNGKNQRLFNELMLQDDSTGNTLLHEICRLDPPAEVIRALAHTMCRIPNQQGATPLHIAASHRMSAQALQVLLEIAKDTPRNAVAATTATANNSNGINDSARGMHFSHAPTADLSNMGRAPIHYACMSFRGLEIDAFLVLLEETLRTGNITMLQEHQFGLEDFGFDDDDNNDLSDEEEMYNDYMSQRSGGVNNSSHHNNLKDNANTSQIASSSSWFNDDDLSSVLTGLDTNTVGGGNNSTRIVNVMSLKDALGMTPLALLFRRYRQRVRSVISTVDKMNRETTPNQAAIASALTVRAELGELWEKARRIIARLTQERLIQEQEQQDQLMNANPFDTMYTSYAMRSPSEAAIHQKAASYALEQHKSGDGPTVTTQDVDEDFLPVMFVQAVTNNSNNNNSTGSSATATDVVDQQGVIAMNEVDNKGGTDAGATARVRFHPDTACRPFRIVHASVGLIGFGCPAEMIRLAISIHPHQVREMDEDGNLPLHIAVKASSYLANSTSLDSTTYAGTNPNDEVSVLSDAQLSFFSTASIKQANNPFDKVIKILLQHYPQGARIPQGKTGELPLVTAIQSGCRTWDDGIRTLLNAYPPALHNKRLIEPSLYPNVLELVTSRNFNKEEETNGTTTRSWSRSKLRRQEACARTTLFELLRTKPEWLTPEGRGEATSVPSATVEGKLSARESFVLSKKPSRRTAGSRCAVVAITSSRYCYKKEPTVTSKAVAEKANDTVEGNAKNGYVSGSDDSKNSNSNHKSNNEATTASQEINTKAMFMSAARAFGLVRPKQRSSS